MKILKTGWMAHSVTNLGPGKRICLWVKGCSLKCPGCMSPELQTRDGDRGTDVEVILKEIIRLAPSHDGLTISGGEPFEQAIPLYHLLSQVKIRTDLDIMVYSGYTLEEIGSGMEEGINLLSIIDVLVDGRYRREVPTRKVWRGSGNQKMWLLSPRALKYRKYIDAEYGPKRSIHLEFDTEGILYIIGIPERGFEEALRKRLNQRGIKLKKSY